MVRPPSMPTTETAPRDDSTGLSSSRADFASSLQRRLDSVNAALSEFEQQPSSPERRDNFLRRVHALRASARVLGFAAASEVLSRAEQQIRTCPTDSPTDDIKNVRKQLELLPNLVLRGAYSVAPPSPPSVRPKSVIPLLSEPLAIALWGSDELVEQIHSIERSTNCLEVFTVEDPDALRSTCAAVGPDVLLLDASRGSITLLVTDLSQAPETSSIPIVVVNVPDAAADGLKELGARLVLPMHAGEHQISQALFQVRHSVQATPPTPHPLGDLSLSELAEQLAQELRQGLVESATSIAASERIALSDGTAIRAALWSALAQIREQVVEASAGRVQFTSGPEGAEPIAPRSLPTARSRTLLSTVDLTGRRILVADDDPAVAWFVGGTLRAAGAVVTEVHDGNQALQLAYRIWPEFVVTDILMPGLDGFALCHALKRDVLLRDLPILLLSWKEDLLFRLRDLGADADGYLRKEASASTIVRRVKELLLPRCALERRLAIDQESRGRLDGTTTRQLLEIAAALNRPVRIALRDASAVYDLRVRHGTLLAATRTRHDGLLEQGESVLGPLLGISAARFSLITDREACEPMFSGSLAEVLLPHALRARAAQRVLSGIKLATVERLTLAPEALGGQLPPLPLSFRPLAEELLRGTAPRKLLASGAAPSQLLEGLLSDLARRGAVLSIEDADGKNLLELEIELLKQAPSIHPPKPAPHPAPRFTFQLAPVGAEPEPGDSNGHLATTSRVGDGPNVAKPAALDAPKALVPTPLDAPKAESPAAPDAPKALVPTPLDELAATRGASGPQRGDATSGNGLVDANSAAATAQHGLGTQSPATRVQVTLRDSTEHLGTDSLVIENGRSERVNDLGKTSPEAPAALNISSAPLASYTPVTSLIPQQVAVTSKPPPSDDFDWALELSWDATPSPAISTLPPPGIVEDPRDAASRFVRHPGASPLEALNPPEAPELAVVVSGAATEATPSAGAFLGLLVPKPAGLPSTGARRKAKGESIANDPADHGAPIQLTMRKPIARGTSPAEGATATNSRTASPTPGDDPHKAASSAVNVGATSAAHTESAATSHGDGHAAGITALAHPVHPNTASTAGSGEPRDAEQDPQPTFDLQKATALSRVTQAADTVTTQKAQTSATTAGLFRPTMQSRDAHVGQTRHEPDHAESPIALPVVNQPPRPKDEATHQNGSPSEEIAPRPPLEGGTSSDEVARRLTERDGITDPVFPLISTSTPEPPGALSSAGIQRAVELGGGLKDATVVASPPTAASPLPTRDTLRSPSSVESESAISLVPIPTPPTRTKLEGPTPEAALSPSTTNAANSLGSDQHSSSTSSAMADPSSPGSANGDPRAPRSAEVVQAEGTPEHRGSTSTDAPEINAWRTLISNSARNEDRTRPKRPPQVARSVATSAPPITVVGSRQVGWLQALGLATLAGIVTFAATVPIASWVHRRHERGPASSSTLFDANPEKAATQAQDSSALRATSELVPAEPTAPLGAAPSASPARSGAVEAPTPEEIPIPSNVVLKPGEGVVEISTGGDHAVFVDDAFVGRGPLRVVPVNAGRHVVRTRLNGNERSDSIDIGAGHALRLSLEQAWK